MQVRLHLVPCVVCGHTGGTLLVGQFVAHRNWRCDLPPYQPPKQRFRPVHWAEKRRAA